MKKQIIFAMLFVSLLIAVGCGPRDTRPSTLDIYKGRNGLVMEFLSHQGEVFEGSPVNMDISLKNDGASNIDEGYLTLALEKDFFSLDRWIINRPLIGSESREQVEFSLEGKSPLNPEGSQGIVSVVLNSKSIEELREKHTSTILLTGCYKYKTKVSEPVCIQTDPIGKTLIASACEVEDKKLDSQGAPVAVTNVEVDMLPEGDKVKPQFIIYITNLGQGDVLKTDAARAACSGETIDYDDYNVISVNAKLFEKQLTCTPSLSGKIGLAKLKEKNDEIRCVLEEGIRREEGTHTETLNIELDYGYTQTISTNIDIRKIPQ